MGTSRFVSIGKITGTHGVRGAVKLLSDSDSAGLLGPDARISVRLRRWPVRGIHGRLDQTPQKGVLIFLKENATFEQARALAGAELLMEARAPS